MSQLTTIDKTKDLLIVLVSFIGMMIIAGSIHIVFADPSHCDQPGRPSCYSVGYGDGKGNSGPCPSGHSSEFCRGWNDATSGSSSSNSASEQILFQIIYNFFVFKYTIFIILSLIILLCFS